MGVVRLRGCPYAPQYSYTPIHLETPICSGNFNRVFILLYHKMFSYFRGSHGVVRLRGYPYTPCMFGCPHMFGCPICWDMPIHLGGSEHMGVSKHMGTSKHTGGIWIHPSLTTPMTASKVGKHFMI